MLKDLNFGNKLVGPSGSKSASIALIGEAPGAYEIREGRPFVGPAGSLLNRLLTSAGIVRSLCYITNVVKEQPPKTAKKSNDISTFIQFKKGSVETTPAFDTYVEQLKAELTETDCNIFVAFGNVPLFVLTGLNPPAITKRRGSIYECTLVPGRKVIAVIHPAACLYTHGDKAGGMYIWQHFILHDLKKAKEESGSRVVKKPGFRYIINPTYIETLNWLKVIKRASPVAFDIEVVNLEVSHISFAFAVDNKKIAISIPFRDGADDYFDPNQEAIIWHQIAQILEEPNTTKIAQNAVFDTQFLFRKYGIVTQTVEDTMVAHGVLVPDLPKGLDYIASIYTDQPYYKDEGKKYMKIGGDPNSFAMYNAKDSAVCLDALSGIKADLKTLGNLETYDRQRKLIPILVYMSERGIKLDVEGIKAEQGSTQAEIDETTEKLDKLAGVDVNWGSPKQVKDFFYGTRGYKPYKKKGGTESVDVVALNRLKRLGSNEATLLLRLRTLSKYYSTYLCAEIDSDNRLRCSFNPVGAADSGRLSSSKTIWNTGMNMQNIPEGFRKHMLFDDGYVGYNIDLSQAENRIVAYIAPEPNMIEAFENGEDIHRKTAALMFGTDVNDVTDTVGTCPICNDPMICGHKGQRFWGKKANHSFNYGLGPFQFALAVGIDNASGKLIRNRYHGIYPGVASMWKWVQEELRKDRSLTNIFSRRRLFLDRWGDVIFKEAYSFIPQSTVADIINLHGLIEIFYNPFYKDVELLNQIHDSVVFQIPLSVGWKRHAELVLAIKKSLEVKLSFRGRPFTIPADIELGRNMKDLNRVEWSTDVNKMQILLQNAWNKTEPVTV